MTVSCPDLVGIRRPSYMTPERDRYLREHSFLDASLLASDLRLSPRWIHKYLRTLGLRRCANKYDK